MPIYEYSCKKCGAHMEVMRKISDKPLARHAKCGGKLEKEWSVSGIQFKGAGWYVNDYAAKKPDTKESNESKESKADSASSKADSSSSDSSSNADSSSKAAGAESKGEAKTKDGKKPASTSTRGGD